MARLPILMYHNISSNPDKSFGLTLSQQKFEEQLQYLSTNQFQSFFVSDLENKKEIPSKSVLLTFDDVTVNQLLYAYPLLIKYNFKATFFIPFAYLGKTDLWNKEVDATGETIMTLEQLKVLDPNVIQLAHHSFEHHKYSEMSEEAIQKDFAQCFDLIKEHQLQVYPALAYPYGNYPKSNPQKEQFFKLLEKNAIKFAFRIGNRLSAFPFKNPFEIQRIDVKGEDSLMKFKLKLRFGKLKLF